MLKKQKKQIMNKRKSQVSGVYSTFNASTKAPNFAKVLTAQARIVAFSRITRL